jgi:iron complex outermembrane recepter protein
MQFGEWAGRERPAAGRRMLARLLLATTALAVLTGVPDIALHPAQAQTAQQSFRIPAGPLAAALAQFGRQAGLQVAYRPELAAGKQSTGVSGMLSPGDALSRLLGASGLSFRFTNASSVTIVGAATADAPVGAGVVALDTINVTGTADGSVGFVASAARAGTKTNTPLIEVPQSISVVTRAQIEEQGAQRVQEALRYTSGVRTEAAGNDTRRNVILTRGFDTGFAGAYLDGLKLPLGGYSGWGELDAYGIQRIEILRGPASVLYGQNTPGGVLNVTSKRPTSTPLREIELSLGNFARRQVGFDFGGPLDPGGTLTYRLTGLARESATQTDFSGADRLFIAPAFTWRPNESTSLTVLTSFQQDRNSSGYDQFPALGTITPSLYGRISTRLFTGEPTFDRYNRDHQFVGYQFEHRVDETWTVRQNARYGHVSLDNLNVWASGLQADQRTLNRRTLSSLESLHSFGIDNQLQAQGTIGAVEHTTLFGIDYQRTWFDQRTGLGNAPPLDAYAPVYGAAIAAPPITTSQYVRTGQFGVYAQEQLKLGRLALTAGLRQDYADQVVDNRLTNTRTSTDASATTWRLGAVYLTDLGLAPYASYSTSFVPNARTDYFGNILKPTTGEQYEVGVKFQPAGSNSFVTVSAFQITQQNVLTTDLDHPGFSVATGEIRSRGIEAEATMSLADGLNLIGTYTYNDVRNTKANTAIVGKTPVYVPAHMASLWASYTAQSGALRGLTVGAGLRYVGATPGDTANTFYVPAVTLVDAAIHYDLEHIRPELKGFRASITANNLFDKEYVSSCFSSSICYWGNRRSVLASLRYRW